MQIKSLKIAALALVFLVINSCQNMDRPELGDYPEDFSNYKPLDGEKLYSNFENTYYLNAVTGGPASKVGSPVLGDPKNGEHSYKGAADSYISYPLTGMYSTAGISFTFWYKVNATPDRAGIITINDNSNDSDDNRKQGLRIFREAVGAKQRIKLNVGIGSGESWNDGGDLTVDGSWVHIAVTVSPTQSKIYFNGVLQRTSTYTTPFDFSTSSKIVVGSGAPSFAYWGHKSDLSLIDDLHVFNKELSQAEIAAMTK